MADHNPDGTFAKGHGCSKGRPPVSRERAYQKAFHDAVTIDEWKKVIRQALKDAQKGNAAARKWLSGYLCGLPAQNIKAEVDVTSTDNPYAELSDEELLKVAQNLVTDLTDLPKEDPKKKSKPRKRATAKKKPATRRTKK